MANDWIRVYETTSDVESEIILSMLHGHGIHAVKLNKIDHAYNNFGKAEIYCRPDEAEQAFSLIATNDEK